MPRKAKEKNLNAEAVLGILRALPADEIQELMRKLCEPISIGSTGSLFDALTSASHVLLPREEYNQRLCKIIGSHEALHEAYQFQLDLEQARFS